MPGQIVDLKQPKRRNSRTLVPLDKASAAARFYARMLRDIESDLGGRRVLSRIESELIRAFCGSATRLEYLNHEILLGEVAEADISNYAQLASTMLRIGSRLGLRRRPRDSAVLDPLEYAARHDKDDDSGDDATDGTEASP